MSTMTRATKDRPCGVCKKDSWCLHGVDAEICMRVPSGRPKTFTDGTVGYLHLRNGSPLPRTAFKKPVETFVDSGRLLKQWGVDYGYKSLVYLAKNLGVSLESLEMLWCTKSPEHCVWAFPMRDGKRTIIGLRMRHENAKKWCNPGGHNGLFIPHITARQEMVICEGPTDTAAALTIDLYAIGRFNCCGGINQIKDFIREERIKRAIIVADCDQDRQLNGVTLNPGIQGAISLSEQLPIPSCTLALPCKDLREFVRRGGNRETFTALVSGLVWRMP